MRSQKILLSSRYRIDLVHLLFNIIYYVLMFTGFKNTLFEYAHSVPLELFTFISTLVEEVLPPIPAPSIITLVGAVAKVQDYSPYSLIILAIIGTIGKTFGATIVYTIVDKLEDIFVLKYG